MNEEIIKTSVPNDFYVNNEKPLKDQKFEEYLKNNLVKPDEVELAETSFKAGFEAALNLFIRKEDNEI